jgi:hypothetical protein
MPKGVPIMKKTLNQQVYDLFCSCFSLVLLKRADEVIHRNDFYELEVHRLHTGEIRVALKDLRQSYPYSEYEIIWHGIFDFDNKSKNACVKLFRTKHAPITFNADDLDNDSSCNEDYVLSEMLGFLHKFPYQGYERLYPEAEAEET